jgi:hypothetical protein
MGGGHVLSSSVRNRVYIISSEVRGLPSHPLLQGVHIFSPSVKGRVHFFSSQNRRESVQCTVHLSSRAGHREHSSHTEKTVRVLGSIATHLHSLASHFPHLATHLPHLATHLPYLATHLTQEIINIKFICINPQIKIQRESGERWGKKGSERFLMFLARPLAAAAR